MGTSASFVTFDPATKGNWIGVYGGQGHVIVGDSTILPQSVQITPVGNAFYTWANPTNDPRALVKPGNPSERVAATWYTPGTFSTSYYDININISDGEPRRLAMHTIDFDNLNRTNVFEIIDTANGNVLDTRLVTGFSEGVYLNWIIRGQVTIRVRNANIGSINAVVTGLFLDNP